jgi:hypothetical protein
MTLQADPSCSTTPHAVLGGVIVHGAYYRIGNCFLRRLLLACRRAI